MHIDRENEELHRSQSLAGFPTKPGYDRDEYPPAMSREGGTGASVRYVTRPTTAGRGRRWAMRWSPTARTSPSDSAIVSG